MPHMVKVSATPKPQGLLLLRFRPISALPAVPFAQITVDNYNNLHKSFGFSQDQKSEG